MSVDRSPVPAASYFDASHDPGAPSQTDAQRSSEADVTAAFRAGPHSFVDVGHSRLAYWRFGSGPDLVFVHGWPLHGATFRRIIPQLADSFTCHVFDLPGTGRTTSRAYAPIQLVAHADTVRRAIDVLRISRYAFVAHDSGGFVARRTAVDDPRAVGLVLGNTEIPGHRPLAVLGYIAAVNTPGGARVLNTLMKTRAVRRSAFGFGGCFTEPSYADGEFGELFVKPLLTSRAVAEGQARPFVKFDWNTLDTLADVHAHMQAPVRLIWGTDDPFFPIALARAMLPQFEGRADFREIRGGKLFVHEDHPAEFVAHAKPFLEECLS